MDKEILDVLAMVAGSLLSVISEFVPAYQTLNDSQKRLVMAGLLVVAGFAVFGLACGGFLGVFFPGLALTCDTGGALTLVRIIFFALVSNQGTHALAFKGRKKAKPAAV